MSFVKSLGKAIFSRTFGGILLLILVGLGIWFGGPYLGFGENRPLEDTGVRVMLLVLILSFVLFWLLHWPVSVVGGAALCLLIWYGSPLLTVGDTQLFAPEEVRMVIVGVIVLLFCLYFGHRLWTALQADNALLKKILHPGAESPAKEQLKEIHHIVRKSLGHLRMVTAQVSGLKRVFQHSRYIYELPWYMIFGAPGTGKTTLVLNSGLKFPLAEQVGGVSLAGIKGTRNCEWWFTDEAVLIDTAGRYTTHETNAEVDAAEWKGFLGLLRKYRPRAPLNGALVAVSVEELMGASPVERNRLAANLRERLTELQNELGVSFPVYFLVTKMDLIQGFRAYFQNLSSEGRRQIFGFTLPGDAKTGRRHLSDIRQACEGELRLLQKRLEQGLNPRLHEEFSPERRRELYCLPGDFSELAAPLMRLMESIFFESRYDAVNIRHLLRGVYFTSAVQEDTPMPRGGLAERIGEFVQSRAAGLNQKLGESLKALAAPRTLVDSRSYFLENTLRKVVFPEAFLVRRNTRWELRFMLVRSLGHVVVLLAAIGLGWALVGSADNNSRLLQDIDQRTDMLADNLRVVTEERREAGIAYVLEQACTLTEFPHVDTASPPFSYRVGLYSASDVNAEAGKLCVALRERFLLPRFAELLESSLAQSIKNAGSGGLTPQRQQGLLDLYETLKLYITFHEPARFDPEVLVGWLASRMAATKQGGVFYENPTLVAALRETLSRSRDFERPSSVRQDLVSAAREKLQPLGRERRLYLLVRQSLAQEAPEDFMPLRFTGEDGALIRKNGTLADAIPGLFTYTGYHEVFQPRLDELLPTALDTDSWIMDDRLKGGLVGNQTELARLNREISKLYYTEYARQWVTLVESIHAGTGASPEQNLVLLNRLGSGDSPLDKLARAVVWETALSAKDTSVTDQLAARAEKRLRTATRTTGLKFGSVDEAALVDNRFASLRKMVTGSTDPASVRAAEVRPSAEMEEIRLLLTEFALYTRDLQKAAANRTLPPASDITERLQAKALQSPPFVSNVLLDLAERGTQQEGASKGSTLATLTEQVTPSCAGLVGSRYPFVPRGRDADPVEFARIFGPAGLIETTFAKNLAAMVDTSLSPWTYTKELPGAPGLAAFERAAELRTALYGTGQDKIWSIPLQVSVVDMDTRIERLEMTIAGKALSYAHGPDKPLEVVWEGGGPKSLVTLNFFPRNRGLKPVSESGPWALFRLLDRGTVVNRISPEEFWVEFDLNGHSLTLAIATQGATPLGTDLFQSIMCPGEDILSAMPLSPKREQGATEKPLIEGQP